MNWRFLGIYLERYKREGSDRVFREEYNHKIEKAIQTIEPITLNKESSKLLNRDINSLALKFDRKVYTKDQSILEYTISIFTSDKHQYQIMMTE